MRFDILTIFPHIFDSYFNESILGRAREDSIISIHVHNIRDNAEDKHKTVDDAPYGGGAGMVLMARPILETISNIKKKTKAKYKKSKVVILSAKGKQFSQKMAAQWAKTYDQLILVTGRYEGIDERVRIITRAEEISIGPYVMTDGDVAAMAVVSAVARLRPGVIDAASLREESYSDAKKSLDDTRKNMREYPHYTRPEILEWTGKKYRVPKVLLSGNHKKIVEWRGGHIG
jgi:tRNA (guanine37-N1)-methyltransferase